MIGDGVRHEENTQERGPGAGGGEPNSKNIKNKNKKYKLENIPTCDEVAFRLRLQGIGNTECQ